MTRCVYSLRALAALFLTLLALLPASPQAAGSSPAETVSRFYAWYLALAAQNENPLTSDKPIIGNDVSGALLKELKKKIESPDGLEADYFLQAQDYFDDWLTDISASTTRISGRRADVTVTLGKTKATRQRLCVSLIEEHNTWKIRSVHPASDPNR